MGIYNYIFLNSNTKWNWKYHLLLKYLHIMDTKLLL